MLLSYRVPQNRLIRKRCCCRLSGRINFTSLKLNSEERFQGEIVASRKGNQSAVPIQGESTIAVAPVHWVDANGDKHIDDGEMLEGSFTIEDMAGVHIDWDDLEELWDAERYSWDAQKKRFRPQPGQP